MDLPMRRQLQSSFGLLLLQPALNAIAFHLKNLKIPSSIYLDTEYQIRDSGVSEISASSTPSELLLRPRQVCNLHCFDSRLFPFFSFPPPYGGNPRQWESRGPLGTALCIHS